MLLLLFGAACSQAASEGTTQTVDATCTSSAPLVVAPYRGTSLANKQLALTFDDGPGSRTVELAQYLASEGIQAGFFVNGKNVPGHANAMPQTIANGHVVANHTQDHYDLTDTGYFPTNAGGDTALVKELSDTDALIAPFVPASRFMFRAPYGAWNARDYSVLSASPMNKYVGTIGWDIGGTRTATTAADWACWQNAPLLTTKACGDLYLQEIASVGRGVVLMHDQDYGDPQNHSLSSGLGNTVDMVKYLVPLLKAQGDTFVRVDNVPDIAAVLPPLPPPIEAGTDAGKDAASDASPPADAGTPEASVTPPTSAPAPTSTGSGGKSPCPPPSGEPSPKNQHAH